MTTTCPKCGAQNKPVPFPTSLTMESLREYARQCGEGHNEECKAMLLKAVDDGAAGIAYEMTPSGLRKG